MVRMLCEGNPAGYRLILGAKQINELHEVVDRVSFVSADQKILVDANEKGCAGEF